MSMSRTINLIYLIYFIEARVVPTLNRTHPEIAVLRLDCFQMLKYLLILSFLGLTISKKSYEGYTNNEIKLPVQYACCVDGAATMARLKYQILLGPRSQARLEPVSFAMGDCPSSENFKAVQLALDKKMYHQPASDKRKP